MIKKLIKIPTNDSKIYLQILSIMNFIVDVTPQEKEVLAELIRMNNDYDVLDEEKRSKFIMSTSSRKEMRDNIKVGDVQFNSLLSRLKKKNLFGKPLLSNDGVLNSELLYKPDEEGYEMYSLLRK